MFAQLMQLLEVASPCGCPRLASERDGPVGRACCVCIGSLGVTLEFGGRQTGERAPQGHPVEETVPPRLGLRVGERQTGEVAAFRACRLL